MLDSSDGNPLRAANDALRGVCLFNGVRLALNAVLERGLTAEEIQEDRELLQQDWEMASALDFLQARTGSHPCRAC